MKQSTRIIIVVFVCLFALPLTFVGAQENDSVGFPDDLNGFIVQTALSGEFADNGDGTHTLTLESGVDFGSWIVNSPEFYAANHSLAEFAGDWSYDDAMEAEAILQLDDMTLKLTLSTPIYFLVDGSFSYTVTVEDIATAVETKEGPVAPTSFERATLIIQLDAAFATSYLTARQARLSETRDPNVQDSCAPWPSPC